MIEVRDLHKYYGDRRALGPVSFDIAEGEIVGFLGLNGAGKTTALRILACDLLPSGGSVRVDGLDVMESPLGIRARIGFLPETPPLYPEMVVADYLRFAGKLRGLAGDALDAALRSTVGMTGLSEVEDDLVGNLSHGFRQRVGIAQAVIHRPRLLILDEPFNGLDPVQTVEMRTMIRSLLGVKTILVSSHILPEISETCDRMLVIRAGEIVASGTEAELSAKMLHGMALEMEVRGDREAVLARVRAVEGVTGVEVESEREGLLSLRVATAADSREALARALHDAGFGLRRLDRAGRELEAVFLELSRCGTGQGRVPAPGLRGAGGERAEA